MMLSVMTVIIEKRGSELGARDERRKSFYSYNAPADPTGNTTTLGPPGKYGSIFSSTRC